MNHTRTLSFFLSHKDRIAVVVLISLFCDGDNQARDNRWSDLKMAVQSFLTVRSMVDAHDVVSIVTFNAHAIEECKMMPLAKCATELETMLGAPSGVTRFAPALEMARTLIDQGTKSPSQVEERIFECACKHTSTCTRTTLTLRSPCYSIRRC